MSDRDERLLAFVQRALESGEVSWDALEADAGTGRERELVRRLRMLRQVADHHRGHARKPGGSGAPEAPELEPGAKWGALEVRSVLGRGAFATVYRARDPELEHDVALKLYRLDPAASRGGRLTRFPRLVKEGRLLTKVRHENVVRVHGAASHDGRPGLWMELVEGRTLAEQVAAQGTLGAEEATLVGLDLCRALAAVHGRGLVYGDVKASNVMRERGGRTVLMDFSAVRETIDGKAAGLAGSPPYLAPETAERGELSPRTDIFGLGVLLYHLVTGEYPRADSGEAVPLRIRRSDLPRSFVEAVERATASFPEDRFADVAEMERALAGPGLGGVAESARSPGSLRFALAAIVAIAVVAGGVWALRDAGKRPFEVDAALYLRGESGPVRLRHGDAVAPGDLLVLEWEASEDLHVYVATEDVDGRATVLFPLPGFDLQNPVPGGRRHLLPGTFDERPKAWSVSSRGGEERLLLVAGREPLAGVENVLAGIPRSGDAPAEVGIPEEALVETLRGIGQLADLPPTPHEGTLARIFDVVAVLGDQRAESRDLWIRQVVLRNP